MPENINGTEYLTIDDAAEAKGVQPSTIYKAIAEARFPATKILGRVLITPADLAAYHPGSYGGKQRANIVRGPGRGKKTVASHNVGGECIGKQQ